MSLRNCSSARLSFIVLFNLFARVPQIWKYSFSLPSDNYRKASGFATKCSLIACHKRGLENTYPCAHHPTNGDRNEFRPLGIPYHLRENPDLGVLVEIPLSHPEQTTVMAAVPGVGPVPLHDLEAEVSTLDGIGAEPGAEVRT